MEGLPNGQTADEAAAARACPPNHLDAAADYYTLNLSVIPLCPPDHSGHLPQKHAATCTRPGKQPPWSWKKYMKQRATAEQVERWWRDNPNLNVGVVTGKVSRIVMVDIDTPEGAAEWERLCGGEAPETWEFGTGRGGIHLVFSWPYDEAPKGNPFKGWEGRLDFLGEEQQSVVPPSLHRSGLRYGWTKGGPESNMRPAVCPEWLRDAVLQAGKKSRARGGVGAAVVGPAPPSPAPVADHLKRAAGYARRFEPAIQGQGGRTVAFRLARKLAHGLHLSDEEALDVMLEEWNGRCVPPWSVEELQERIASARRDGSADTMPDRPGQKKASKPTDRSRRGGTGGKATGPISTTSTAEANGAGVSRATMSADVVCRAYMSSASAQQDTEGDGAKRPHTQAPVGHPGQSPDPPAPPSTSRPVVGVLASEIKRHKRRYFCKPWFPHGVVSLIIGRGNTGKSTMLAYLLAKAKRPVLFPGFEEDVGGDLLDRLEAAGVNLGNLLVMANTHLYLFSDAHKLASILSDHKADLVAFDPLDSYIHPEGMENDNTTVRTALEQLSRVIHEADATAIGIRHPGKAAGNLVRGCVAWRNAPRAVVGLRWDDVRSEKRTLWVDKFPHAPRPPAQHFKISGEEDGPGKFEVLGAADAGMLQVGEEVPDRLDQSKIIEARRFLRAELRDGPVDAGVLFARGKTYDLSPNTLRRAADLDGVERQAPDKNGPGAKWLWHPPKRWPRLD
jgi:hypothetical protein